MQHTVAVPGGRLRLKAIPLNQLPEEAWTSLGGKKGATDIHDLYKSVPWLFAGVNIIAHAVASLPRRVLIDGEVLDDPDASYPFLADLGDLLDAMTGDLLLYGAAYARLTRQQRRRPQELRRLHPKSIEPVYDDEQGLVGFTRTEGSVRLVLRRDDLAYRWVANRESERNPGVPPAFPALAAAGILANVDAAASAIFRNGAILPTIAVVADILPEAEVQQLRSRIQRLISGVKNAFSIPVISRDIEFKTVGEYPDRLAMPELTDKKREDIATALGVPQTLLFSQAANFATAEQEAYQFYDTTVIPYAKVLFACLNKQLSPLVLETAEDELELYQSVEADRVSALVALRQAGAITLDEVRQRAGFPELTEEQRAELEEDDPPVDEETTEPPPLDGDDDSEDEPAAEDPTPAEARRMAEELGKWERYALKRLGKSSARAFETSALHPTFAAAVAGALDACTSGEQVREVFRHAVENMEYP